MARTPAVARPTSFEAALREIVQAESGEAASAEVTAALDRLEQDLRTSGKLLTSWFFDEAGFSGIAVSAEAADVPTATETLRTRRGSCLPLVAIYVSLVERTGIHAVPVATPRHVFIRESGAGGPRNVELLEAGRERPDGDYLRQEKALLDDARAKTLLHELSPRQLLAYLLNNHAVRLRAQGKLNDAGAVYRRALRLDADCEPCQFNFGNLLAAQGKRRDALRHYDRALELHPWDEEAEKNRSRVVSGGVAAIRSSRP